MNHNYHDDLFYFPRLALENVRRDTGANLLQDLFAAARRIEIKAIINVFSVHMHREKDSTLQAPKWYFITTLVIENIKAH